MCFQRATTTEVPDFVAHNDLWFEDGNLFILALDPVSKVHTAFKLHAGMILSHSEAMTELIMEQLGITDPDDLDEHDWMNSNTYITLDDHPVDVAYWLSAIYDGLDFDILDKKRLATLRGVLLLSKKYNMEELYRVAYELLLADYPVHEHLWAEREKRCRTDDGTQMLHPLVCFASAIHAIQLAKELDLPEILPAAFYDLARYTTQQICTGTGPLRGAEHIPRYSAQITYLSEKDFTTLTQIKEWAFRFLRDVCQVYLIDRAAVQNCATPEKDTCKMAYEFVCDKVMRMMVGLPGGDKYRRAGKSMIDPLLALQRVWIAVRQRDTDILLVDAEQAKLGDTEPKPIVCCAACAERLRTACLRAKHRCWVKMAEFVAFRNLSTDTTPLVPSV